jgi:hypothetical protein
VAPFERAEAALVEAWDRAVAQPAWRRALVLLAIVDGVRDVDCLPVGAVATRLLALARRWSVHRIETVATCAVCADRLDVVLNVDDLLARAPRTEPGPDPFPVPVDGQVLQVRLPTPADLAAVATYPDPDSAERELLRRCVSGPTSESTAEAVSAAMAERDPYGVIAVDLTCPGCATPARVVLDVADWWWGITEARVQRLFGEVHRLARAYGWTEPEVLALGPHRRSAYLELVP